MDYTTPDFSGFNATVGIFDPVNSLTASGTNAPKKAPGLQAQGTYTYKMSDDMKFYASVAGLTQKQDYTGVAAALGGTEHFTSSAGDVFVKFDMAGFEADLSYYHGKGLGTTGLFFLADDGMGNARS